MNNAYLVIVSAIAIVIVFVFVFVYLYAYFSRETDRRRDNQPLARHLTLTFRAIVALQCIKCNSYFTAIINLCAPAFAKIYLLIDGNDLSSSADRFSLFAFFCYFITVLIIANNAANFIRMHHITAFVVVVVILFK